MSDIRSIGALVGTNFSTGVSIATTVTTTGTVADILGDNASEGEVDLFLVYTFPNAAPTAGGTIQVKCYPSWDLTNGANAAATNAPILYADVAVQNATHQVYIGTIRVSRFMTGVIINSATGQTITNAALLYQLTKRF